MREFECIGGPCSINLPTGQPYRHSFSTEPRLRQIDPGGPGAGLLHDGDVLVAVDGQLITTATGGHDLGSLRPGEPVTLTLRRSGVETDVTLVPRASCDFPGLRVRSADRSAYAYGTAGIQRGWVSGDSIFFFSEDADEGEGAGERLWGQALGGNERTDLFGGAGPLRPPAELGVELQCGDCGFRIRNGNVVFETERFPVVASIEKGGPADEAGLHVDDVLLTVGGRAITAGRTLGVLRAGRPVAVEVRRGNQIVELTVTPREPSLPRQRG